MARTFDGATGELLGSTGSGSGLIYESGLYYDPSTNTYYQPGDQPGATPAQVAAGAAASLANAGGSATTGPGTVTITAPTAGIPWWVWAAVAAIGGVLLWKVLQRPSGRVVRRIRPA